MLQNGRWPNSTSNTSRTRKPTQVNLSDDELRKRIFANAAILFPASHSTTAAHCFEIIYAQRPRVDQDGDEPPWQYAMVVQRNPQGGYTPLIKGQACSSSESWKLVLGGLLDTTAILVHKTIGQAPMPTLGILERLPPYSPPATQRAN